MEKGEIAPFLSIFPFLWWTYILSFKYICSVIWQNITVFEQWQHQWLQGYCSTSCFSGNQHFLFSQQCFLSYNRQTPWFVICKYFGVWTNLHFCCMVKSLNACPQSMAYESYTHISTHEIGLSTICYLSVGRWTVGYFGDRTYYLRTCDIVWREAVTKITAANTEVTKLFAG